MAQKNGRQIPIITWQTNYFADKYTPQQRCEIVSAKLQNAVLANGDSFSGLRFQEGYVNAQLVVCVLSRNQTYCDFNTMLFTLKPENRSIVGNILEELTNFNTKRSTSILDINESEAVDISGLEQKLNQDNSD